MTFSARLALACAALAVGALEPVGVGLALAEPADATAKRIDLAPAPEAPGDDAAPLIPVIALPNANPIVKAVVALMADKTKAPKASNADIAAAMKFYGTRTDPVWIESGAFSDKAKSLIGEFAKASDWGLDPAAFAGPDVAASLSAPEAAAEAETKLTLAALTYARHARGGRVRPLSITQMLDLTPPVKDPEVVLNDLAAASAPAEVLTGLHPKHAQFVKLREALIKSRGGPVEPAAPIDPVLAIKIPDGPAIKPGSLHSDISLLRKRLKVPADFAGRDTLYDDKLVEAVKGYQTGKGLKSNGQLNQKTRAALNSEGEPERRETGKGLEQRIVINMERWRWMPEDMGDMHVVNNVPEFTTRTFKAGREVFKEKIIVGQPSWPTPSFSAELKSIVFNPSWGVPDGIKAKELKPRLQKAGGGGFFDQLFGGSGGGASVLKAYGLTAYKNGKVVDPNSIDWSSADLRTYSFIQPPGGQNPLGVVKFLFPNSHDVYMHDTTQRDLFASSQRPFSHGCIRVQNPRKFAEILLAEDKAWGPERVAAAQRSSETVTLDRHVMVHNVYLTAWAEDDGKVRTFGDVYGLDGRVSKAIGNGNLQYDNSPPDTSDIETASVGDDGDEAPVSTSKKRKGADKKKVSKSNHKVPESMSEAMSGLLGN